MKSIEMISPNYYTVISENRNLTDQVFYIDAKDLKQICSLQLDDKNGKKIFYKKHGKKIFEMFLLILIIVPVLLMMITIYLLLLIPNKGKVIFKQKRIGLYGKPFTIYKFKTLTNLIDVDIEKNVEIIKNNSHAFGMFLRKTGLDEMPQFINVIKGQMNMIGPRPLLMKDLNHLSYHQFIKRHMIKPGICGLWQIRRQYSNNLDLNFRRYDDFYLEKQSLLFDSSIIFSSIMYIFKGKGR